jgi:hypothetical protein
LKCGAARKKSLTHTCMRPTGATCHCRLPNCRKKWQCRLCLHPSDIPPRGLGAHRKC